MIAFVVAVAMVIAPPADAAVDEPPADAPVAAPADAAAPVETPGEVVIRVDPLDERRQTPPPAKPPKAAPDPTPPHTEHYGIASRAANRDDLAKHPPPPKPVPSEEAVARDTGVELEAEGTGKDKGKPKRPGSPQRFELEFKLGPYLPDVDRRYEGPGFGPYAMIYGRTDGNGVTNRPPRLGVMPVVGFEWQFLYLAGPLGIGTQIGFFRDKAKALLLEPPDSGSVRSAADDTSFGMVPLALLLTYRLEIFADQYKVPLVPYAKGGLAYAFWWSRDGNGDIARNMAGQRGRGGVPGWQVNLGGMLRLDFIEPSVAQAFDKLTGINHTYIFGEYQLSRINNFGVGNTISLGDSTWFAGLAIEF